LIEDFSQQQTSRTLIEEFLAFHIRSGRPSYPDWHQRPTIKIILSLLGASGVGKTVLGQCLQYGRLPENLKHSPSTLGIDVQFYYLDRLFRNEYVVIIQLNDPPGQEKYEAATNHFFRQCHGVLLLADTTRMDTLERLEQYWYSKLQKLALDNVQSVLVCTKIDLLEKEKEDYRHLFFQQAEKFAFLHQMPIVQVSAYRGDNVEHIFQQLIIRIMSDEILVNDLISRASQPDDLIKRRRNSLTSSNIIPLGSSDHHQSQERIKEKGSKCCGGT
jgi:small GTP-binding protein